MAGYGGISGVVRDGLVFGVDAADKNSYPGRITDWDDIVGSSHGDLIGGGGPTYSSNNKGYYTFDGNNDEIDFTAHKWTAYADNFTIEFWCKPTTTHEIDTQSNSSTTGTSGQKYMWYPYHASSNSGIGISLGTNGISIYEHGDSYMPPIAVWSGTVSSTLFSHVVITYTAKQGRIYLNGVLEHTGLTSSKSTVWLGMQQAGEMAYGDWAGAIALIRAYNRPLTLAEIQSNFNAQRYRYGV
jgi:hypothetical protein